MHVTTNPAIHYFGTPVVLLSTLNEDGTPNLAPMSSAWWLGRSCLLGLAAGSHTTRSLRRTGECVLNLPSDTLAGAVDRIARTTGADPVPPWKAGSGYRHVHDKFGEAGLTPIPSDAVGAPRAAECPVHLEARLVRVHPVGPGEPAGLQALEVEILRVHVEEELLVPGAPNRIDPDRWRPLIMSFQHFYGLAPERVHASQLARIPEERYR